MSLLGKFLGFPQQSGVDPDLARRLRERGEYQKLLALKREIKTPTPVKKKTQQVFKIGEGLKKDTTVLRPGPTKKLAALPKKEQVKFSLTEKERLSPSALSHQNIQNQLTKARQEGRTKFAGKTTKEKVEESLTIPIRWTAGSLARLTTQYALEKTGADLEFTPRNRTQELLIGEEPIRKLSEQSLTYGLTQDTLEKAGVPEEFAKKPALFAAMFVGAVIENPFFLGAGKGGQKLFRKSMQEMVEKEVGEKLEGQALRTFEKQADEIYTSSFAKAAKDKTQDVPKKPLSKTEKDLAVKRLVEEYKIKKLTPEQKVSLKTLNKDIQTGITKKTEMIKKTYKDIGEQVEKKMVTKVKKYKEGLVRKGIKTKAEEIGKIKLGKAVRKEQLKTLKIGITIRSAKDKVISNLKNRAINTAEIKKSIYQFTKRALPPAKQGKLNASIASAKTRSDLSRAFRMIMKTRETIAKVDATKNLEKIVKDIDNLPIHYQDKIMEEIGDISFKGISEKTVDKLNKLQDFLNKQPEAKFMFGKKTIKNLRKLPLSEKNQLKEMPLRDIMALDKKITRLKEEGKVANKVTEETKRLKTEIKLDELQKGSYDIDKGVPPTIGRGLSSKEKLVNKKYQAAEMMQKGYMNYVSADVGFEVLDNGVRNGVNYKTFKKPFDDAFWNYKETNAKIVNNYFDFKKGLEKKYGKFKQQNQERIMIYATKMQEGGRAKLIKSGMSPEIVDGTRLSISEMQLYNNMRGTFDQLHPHIDSTLRKVHGEKLGKVDNYFSWQTDFNNSDEVFSRLSNDFKTSRTSQGFTKERSIVGKQILKLNAEDVFLKHTNDATYFIHSEELLNGLGKIARDDKYTKAVGTQGQKWVNNWIDLMARKGIPAGYTPSVGGRILRNIGGGILGYRLSPIAKQPIAKITSASLLGPSAFKYDPEFFSKNLGQYVKNISKQQKFRTFDDPAFVELAKNKKLAKWQEVGYSGIKWVDAYTADSVWYGAYRKYYKDNKLKFSLDEFKAGKSNKEALEYADYITRRTQGSGEVKDLASMLTGQKKDVFKAILQFQSFVLNESYLIPHDAIGVALRKKKNVGKALGIIGAVMTAGIAEDYVTSGMAQIWSSDKYAKEEREKKITNRMFDSLITKVPFLNNVYGQVKYSRTGVPLLDIWLTGIAGAKSAIYAKTDEAKKKGLSKVIESFLNIVGISGAGQAGQAYRRYGIGETKKSKGPVKR